MKSEFKRSRTRRASRAGRRIRLSDTSIYDWLKPLYAQAEARFLDVFDAVDSHAESLLAIGEAPAPAARWRQDWFPRMDAAAAYALVQTLHPEKVIEVGAGHSTRWFARAVADGGLATKIHAIDPAPRAPLPASVALIRQPVQSLLPQEIAILAENDVVSLDGSHILAPGSDVDFVMNGVLPRLPPGVCLHIHDVFLPAPYPQAWTWRGYNEQQAIAILLQGGAYELIWSSQWALHHLADRLQTSVISRLPLLPGAYETSLWLRKRGEDTSP